MNTQYEKTISRNRGNKSDRVQKIEEKKIKHIYTDKRDMTKTEQMAPWPTLIAKSCHKVMKGKRMEKCHKREQQW